MQPSRSIEQRTCALSRRRRMWAYWNVWLIPSERLLTRKDNNGNSRLCAHVDTTRNASVCFCVCAQGCLCGWTTINCKWVREVRLIITTAAKNKTCSDATTPTLNQMHWKKREEDDEGRKGCIMTAPLQQRRHRRLRLCFSHGPRLALHCGC